MFLTSFVLFLFRFFLTHISSSVLIRLHLFHKYRFIHSHLQLLFFFGSYSLTFKFCFTLPSLLQLNLLSYFFVSITLTYLILILFLFTHSHISSSVPLSLASVLYLQFCSSFIGICLISLVLFLFHLHLSYISRSFPISLLHLSVIHVMFPCFIYTYFLLYSISHSFSDPIMFLLFLTFSRPYHCLSIASTSSFSSLSHLLFPPYLPATIHLSSLLSPLSFTANIPPPPSFPFPCFRTVSEIAENPFLLRNCIAETIK